MDPILVGGAISLITVLLVSASGSVSLESQNFREQLHKAPTNNQDSQEIARTLIWPKMMIITGVIVVALLINFYAKPYENAITNYELRAGEQL
jgi:sodium/pantothenate symporter